ncbi:hypothetical protein J6Z48_01350 [bacterium]|nr:hypothetical protein [bacterium]
MKIIKGFVLSIILILSVLVFPKLCLAGSDQEINTNPLGRIDDWIFDEDYDLDYEPWNYDYDDIYSVDTDFLDDLLEMGLLGFGFVVAIFVFFIAIASYVYGSLTLYRIANRLNYGNSWLAWIPILNLILLFQLGDMSPWLLLLVFIPFIGVFAVLIIRIIVMMNICKKYGYDSAMGLLSVIHLANLILLGILAWGKVPQKQVSTKTVSTKD